LRNELSGDYMKKIMSTFFWRYLPLSMQKSVVRLVGGFLLREKFGIANRPWYAYGMLSAAKLAAKHGYKEIMAIEFGVANGRGLRNMAKLAKSIEYITGVKIRLVGFDTGKGMPQITDFRDHPEVYREGDYPLLDEEALRNDVGDDLQLLLGDISETTPGFVSKLSKECPIGFFSMDVDVWSSSKAALKLFEHDAEFYLPMVFGYFDDCSSRSHFNKFCGELLAIEEFNQEHELRKIDIDRGVWNNHRHIGPQIWYERMHILHLFDHPKRFPQLERAAKIISG
jgi:hypothetical protein